MRSRRKILALDLEGTLVSNAVSQIARPGLKAFLEFCFRHFDRVVLFTTVPKERARAVIAALAGHGDAPQEVLTNLEYVEWTGSAKDLGFIEGCSPQDVLLVDDQETYIAPGQKRCWVPLKEFESPYPASDHELETVQRRIEARLREDW